MRYLEIQTKTVLAVFFLLTFSSCAISFDTNRYKVFRDDALQFNRNQELDTLRIDSFNGEVTLVTGEDNATLQGVAKTWAYGKNEDQAHKRLSKMEWVFTTNGNTLNLKLKGNNGGSHLTELKVPAKWNLDVDTGNGRITIPAGFKNINAQSSNGAIFIVGGDRIEADTSNGRIEYNGSSPDFNLDTSNGKVRVQLNGNWQGNGTVHSSNGRLSVVSSGIIDARVKSSTSNGKTSIYGPKLSKTSGTGKLSLITNNGHINITHGVSVQ
ncbi:MAG: hypothetical protein HOM14_18500 [Gammaproteobacteria bacterium]|jgi:DUF4097 and DUF4098 domain-containing protein YvlB|nr:hypothetical protein [Gammaproteobacteria bacterium]MBT3723374.1 hypothetical protein [Gammaproteobacteria bacterium]MBT4193843.1 hypothetical protein [Gammaproteobacteria bacterium]MBT4449359.1 hypothetical protein [Gammaproteobacteria bacterium]MBT4859185.1 hypothetical protein [Gammaproteobacteria bacterium]